MVAAPSALNRGLRRALRSAPAVWAKHTLRDGYWAWRDQDFANPEWPATVRSMLFLCYGNICRSPFAAGLASRRLSQLGVSEVRCGSAGFRANQAASPPPDAVEAAAAYQVDLRHHHPTLLLPELILAHDVVFVMEPGQLATLRQRWPAHSARYFLLPRYDSLGEGLGAYQRLHFVDPFNQGPEAFARSYARIASAVDHVARLCRR